MERRHLHAVVLVGEEGASLFRSLLPHQRSTLAELHLVALELEGGLEFGVGSGGQLQEDALLEGLKFCGHGGSAVVGSCVSN